MRAGADLGGTKLLLLAESEEGRVTCRVPTGRGFDPAALETAIAAFLAGLPVPASSFGLSFPGLVDAAGTVAACDVLPRFVGWRIPTGLAHAVVNDGDAALIAEARHHAPGTTLAVIVVGTGIGAAFQGAAGRIVGAHGWAGELGSIPLSTGTGARTLDELASGQALLEGAGCGFEELLARVRAGEPRAVDAVREAGAALGLGIATVIHLLDPSAIALGGGVLALPGYLDAALGSARARTLPSMWDGCVVAPLRDGDQAAAIGAALAASRRAGEE